MAGICTYKDNKFMSKIYFWKKIKIRYSLFSAMCLNSGLNGHSSLTTENSPEHQAFKQHTITPLISFVAW